MEHELFVIDDIEYKILSNTEVEVHKAKNKDITTCTINENVVYNEKTFIVTGIGYYAFSRCSSLTSVIFHDSLTTIGNGAFSGCSCLTSVTIPKHVTNIGNYSFWSCSSLTSIMLPASLTSIGDRSFAFCKGLTSVVLPASLTSIVDSAFYGCSGLTSVTFPASLTSIGDLAFSDCYGLTEIICNMKKEPLIGIDAFKGVSKHCILILNQDMKVNPELWNVGKVINGRNV